MSAVWKRYNIGKIRSKIFGSGEERYKFWWSGKKEWEEWSADEGRLITKCGRSGQNNTNDHKNRYCDRKVGGSHIFGACSLGGQTPEGKKKKKRHFGEGWMMKWQRQQM